MIFRPIKASHASRSQLGVSLIELMVALVIAALLGIGLVQIFGSTRAAFNSNSALARAQENSRFAIGFIEHDLRMVAHMGLSNEQGYMGGNVFNHLSSDGRSNSTVTPYLYRTHLPVQGFGFAGTENPVDSYEMYDEPRLAAGANAWSPALPTASELGIDLSKEALAGSDVLLLRFLSAEHVSLKDVSADASVSGPVQLDGTILWDSSQSPEFLKEGGVFGLTNYSRLSLFFAQPDETGTGQTKAALGGKNLTGWPAVGGAAGADEPNYGQGSSLYRYEVVVYYVAEGADGQPALFRRRLGPSGDLGEKEELVPGVDMMQVTYGVVDSDPRRGDRPTRYLAAEDIEGLTWRATIDEQWADVVSVRVGLLMRSNLPSASGVETRDEYNVAGVVVVPPDDRRLRHVYETQVALRNRSRG